MTTNETGPRYAMAVLTVICRKCGCTATPDSHTCAGTPVRDQEVTVTNHPMLNRLRVEQGAKIADLFMPHVPKSDHNNDRMLAMAAGLPGSPFTKDAAGRLRRNGRFAAVK